MNWFIAKLFIAVIFSPIDRNLEGRRGKLFKLNLMWHGKEVTALACGPEDPGSNLP